jgi:hypothetical protein
MMGLKKSERMFVYFARLHNLLLAVILLYTYTMHCYERRLRARALTWACWRNAPSWPN